MTSYPKTRSRDSCSIPQVAIGVRFWGLSHVSIRGDIGAVRSQADSEGTPNSGETKAGATVRSVIGAFGRSLMTDGIQQKCRVGASVTLVASMRAPTALDSREHCTSNNGDAVMRSTPIINMPHPRSENHVNARAKQGSRLVVTIARIISCNQTQTLPVGAQEQPSVFHRNANPPAHSGFITPTAFLLQYAQKRIANLAVNLS